MQRSPNGTRNGLAEVRRGGDWMDRLPAPAVVLRRTGEAVRCNAQVMELLEWRPGRPARLGGAGVPWFDRLLAGLDTAGRHRTVITRRVGGGRRSIEVRASALDTGEVLMLLNECPRTSGPEPEPRERQLRAFLRRLPAAVLIEQDGAIVHANPAAGRLFGGSRASLLRRPVAEVIPSEMIGLIGGPPAAERGGPVTFEVQVPWTGAEGTLEVAATAITYRGRPARQLLVRDVSERRRTEEQLRLSQEQLLHAQKLEAMGRLAAGVAHDFNNVLTAIQGHLQFLLQELPEDGGARADALEIRRAADRAGELTRQLLTFARKRASAPREVDLNDVLSRLQQLLRRLLRPGIALQAVLDSDLPTVWADAGQLEQVIVNLVVNARDALGPSNGTIVLRTSRMNLTEPYRDRDFLLRPGSYSVLSVTDNGCGMSHAMRMQVFEPFFTTKVDGTGLGLSTTYGIVKQAGGLISVYSEEQVGTTFKVFLPAIGGHAEDLAGGTRDMEPAGATGTVLLVEDDDAVRLLAASALEQAGFQVLQAANGAEALRAARAGRRIDVVVTDLGLPGMRGDQLASLLAAVQPQARLVLVSGFAEAPMLVDGGVRDRARFLEKPFTPASLVSVIRQAAAA